MSFYYLPDQPLHTPYVIIYNFKFFHKGEELLSKHCDFTYNEYYDNLRKPPKFCDFFSNESTELDFDSFENNNSIEIEHCGAFVYLTFYTVLTDGECDDLGGEVSLELTLSKAEVSALHKMLVSLFHQAVKAIRHATDNGYH